MKRLTAAAVIGLLLLMSHLVLHALSAAPQDLRLVSVSCAGNPEKTTIQNTGLLSVSLNGYAVTSLRAATGGSNAAGAVPFYPLPPSLSLNPGQQLTFLSGPAAPPSSANFTTLTRLYIYDHATARNGSEGAALSFNGQAVSSIPCSETRPSPSPSPSPQATPVSPLPTPSASPTPFTAFASPSPVPTAPAPSPSPTPSQAPSTGTPSPFPSASPTPTSSVPPVSGPSGSVTYAPGWNFVGAPQGTTLTGALALISIAPDGAGFRSIDPGSALIAGQAYWAYFPAGPAVVVTLSPSNLQSFTLPIRAGDWSFVGNPTQQRVNVLGADIVETYDPQAGFVQNVSIPPGEAAAVYSASGSAITLTTTAATTLPVATEANEIDRVFKLVDQAGRHLKLHG